MTNDGIDAAFGGTYIERNKMRQLSGILVHRAVSRLPSEDSNRWKAAISVGAR